MRFLHRCRDRAGKGDVMDNRNKITIVLFIASIILIVAGIMRGEHLAVLNKAINICMQCIGIG